jgi:uncharacterized protein YPO0396
MWNLFSSDSEQEGYRLSYMEVYNWGTFHNRIYRIEPQGKTSLLTGANGSGKTTWVDALLTLVVPEKRHRFYNQSSGTEKKGDRSEETYVLGNYGDTRQEGKSSAQAQQLRPDKKSVYSIILACFQNERTETITLFQARWFVDGELKRVYGIAYRPLKIAADFIPFDPVGQWKKRLELQNRQGNRRMVEFFDGPQKYAERFTKISGMRSEKALPLFNQTVGIKVLGNLDEFIRTHMLEQQDIEAEFEKLKANFNTLVEAEKNMEKAELRITLLLPLRQLHEQMAVQTGENKICSQLLEINQYWFAEQKLTLLNEAIQTQDNQLDLSQKRINRLEIEVEGQRRTAQDLNYAIKSDTVGQRLNEVGQEIKSRERERDKRQQRCNDYNKLTERIGLPSNPKETEFYESYHKLKSQIGEYDREITKIDERIYSLRREIEQLDEGCRNAETELTVLARQKNNITGRVAEIREELVACLGVNQATIPFVGELIRVRPEEKEWEGAIERLLHNFAQRLIVPEQYYARVNAYVNRHNLRGRLIYHRVRREHYLGFHGAPDNSLYEKLEFNIQHEYAEWVAQQIQVNYDYICTDDLNELEKYKKALTSSGLIKSSDRHEKDDRPQMTQRDHYVLGWDNKEKIRWWRDELKRLHEDGVKVRKAFEDENNKRSEQDRLRQIVAELGGYQHYEEIDWQSEAGRITKLYQEKQELENTNDRVKQLQIQLENLQNVITGLDLKIKQEYEVKGRCQDQKRHLEKQRQSVVELLQNSGPRSGSDYDLYQARLRDHLSKISLEDVDQRRDRIKDHLMNERQRIRDEMAKLRQNIQRKINHFKNPPIETLERFKDWQNDTFQLPDDPDYLDEYLDLLKKLEQDDLPGFRRRFEDYLSSTMLIKIADFKQSLDEWQENIEESIAALNNSLQQINFRNNPETYIQLRYQNRVNVNVKEFRQMLMDAFPVAIAWTLDEDGAKKKAHFVEKIMPLVHKLDENPNWRKEVIDVRNWKNYYAEERYRETDRPMKVYVEMGSLSGGEKAQLTYTILGSALAYQFGIAGQSMEQRSFRFIAVDESFSNQDEEKATYLMDLCRQLHLQLLVVTPCDKIHIVEPYISYVHYVERVDNRESVLYDMPITQFQAEREQGLTRKQ